MVLRHVLRFMMGLALSCSTGPEPGAMVWVDWEGRAEQGQVIQVLKDGKVRVTYPRLGPAWDEVVPKERLVQAPKAVHPTPAPSSSAGYKPGQRVQVDWAGRNLRATILQVKGPDQLRVRYDGEGEEWDETVHSSRISTRSPF